MLSFKTEIGRRCIKMRFSLEERKRAKKLFLYQLILWGLIDLLILKNILSNLIPDSVVLSFGIVILGEFMFTVISIYMDIRFSRYLNRIKTQGKSWKNLHACYGMIWYRWRESEMKSLGGTAYGIFFFFEIKKKV